MIRILDFFISLTLLILLAPILFSVFLIVFVECKSPLFFQKRMGRFEKPFILVKFRTMHKDTLSMASHLVNKSSITKIGKFLRKYKLDELPQLYNVLVGDMSLVGPRPGLFEQKELYECRKKLNVYSFRPGITGLSQINNIDMSTPILLAKYDNLMLSRLNLHHYFKYLFLTLLGRGIGDAIK